MTAYRIYFIDSRGRISLGDSLSCTEESEALARLHAARRPDAQYVELWRGGRLIRRVPGASGPAA